MFRFIGSVEGVKDKKVVVFDLDGVLVDDRERVKTILREMGLDEIPVDRVLRRRFWEIYFSDKYMELNKPVEKYVSIAKELSLNFPIVIVTYRVFETQHIKTIEQLTRWGIPFSLAVFRHQGVRVRPSEFKVFVIKELGLNVYKAFDDSEEVCEAYRLNGIDVECVKDVYLH